MYIVYFLFAIPFKQYKKNFKTNNYLLFKIENGIKRLVNKQALNSKPNISEH